jgi:hypothetical protein
MSRPAHMYEIVQIDKGMIQPVFGSLVSVWGVYLSVERTSSQLTNF